VTKLIKKSPDSYFVPKEFSFYARSQNCEERLLVLSCLSVRLHGTTLLPLDGL
jgi:hypothetical protein